MKHSQEEFTLEALEKYRAMASKHLLPPSMNRTVAYTPGGMKLFIQENGCRVKDITGKTYIDGFASLMYKNTGYGRKEINNAIYEQLQQLSGNVYFNPSIPTIKLAKKLADITPGDLSVVFFGCNGSDAIETGIKMARHYQRLCGFQNRYKVICRRREYHGTSFGTMSLALPIKKNHSHVGEDYAEYGPLLPGTIRVTPPYCYRCEYGLSYPKCDIKCARQVEEVILREGPETIAAFMSTPVSTNSLCNVPPMEYWPIIRSICDKYEIILQMDCIVTGFGRTGKMFATEHFGVVPDIMSVAKGITSGYFPLSATIVSNKIAEKFEPNSTFNHVYTFGGHPAACAGALVNIEIIEKESLVENSSVVGKYLYERLQELIKHPIVGDVRGIGLLCVIEYVRDKKTKESLDEGQTTKLNNKITEAGLLTRTLSSATSLSPPLIFTKDDANETVAIIENAIKEIEREVSM